MTRSDRKIGRNSVLRIAAVGICVIAQIAWLILRMIWLNAYSGKIAVVTDVLALVLILSINYKNTNPSMKMPWIMLIMAFPVMGLCLYLLLELLGDPGVGKRLRQVRGALAEHVTADGETLAQLADTDANAAGQCCYVSKTAGYPLYQNTAVEYYAEATDAFAALKQALSQAERFIFMEYFIVEDGAAFREVEQILAEKAAAGVQVRLLYDDIGSVGTTNMRYAARLNKMGIRCVPFNPAIPFVNLFMNHRDHRKITIVDGKVAFTGGFNLADEYFGRKKPYGHWKDTGLRLEGEAVQAMTAIFLELWSVQTKQQENFTEFLSAAPAVEARGFVQPFGDDPLGQERIAENVYLNMIHGAQKCLYLITPYLIITDEMSHALTLAAKRGVDVRIVTPGIPDKKTVYQITRSYYGALVQSGVRIYEYTPGFCHAKMCICDGRIASVGTSNLDYRSLYHHFENDVLLVGCPAIDSISADFAQMFRCSREVTADYRKNPGLLLKLWRYILRVVAPLL